MVKRSKAKGDQFERDLCAHLSSTLGLSVHRRCLTTQFIENPGVGAPDLIGTPSLAIEAKRTERLEPEKFLAQAIRNAAPGETPVVIHRRSRQSMDDATVLLRLGDFIRLYEAYLDRKGLRP